jgi:hypothetical protein
MLSQARRQKLPYLRKKEHNLQPRAVKQMALAEHFQRRDSAKSIAPVCLGFRHGRNTAVKRLAAATPTPT